MRQDITIEFVTFRTRNINKIKIFIQVMFSFQKILKKEKILKEQFSNICFYYEKYE